MDFERPAVPEIEQGLSSRVPLLQVVVGPRQVGKSTAAQQIEKRLAWPSHSASADSALPHPPEWIETQWQLARLLGVRGKTLLVLDEIQKVRGWSEVAKRLWDEERAKQGPVRPLLLGSSALLLQRGLNESLSGRFFLHRFKHWTWPECQAAFGWNLDQWIYLGVNHGTDVWALEVKSGRSGKQGGVEAFRKAYPKAKVWLLGADGVKLEEFFSRPAPSWFS